MMKVSGKKKDEKSTTALARMRGKWDMKRNVFLTYLSDNMEADRPLEKPFQHIKKRAEDWTGRMFQTSGSRMCVASQEFQEIMAALL